LNKSRLHKTKKHKHGSVISCNKRNIVRKRRRKEKRMEDEDREAATAVGAGGRQ
jgi:hypothetical protein